MTHHQVHTSDVPRFESFLDNMGINVDDTVEKPNIEGVFAYHKTWDAAMSILGLAVDHAIGIARLDDTPNAETLIEAQHGKTIDRSFGLAGAAANASALSRGMANAHPITIHPDQYAALPDWETLDEAFDYATHVKLPFDTCWFDLELPHQSATRDAGGKILKLNGALMSIQDDVLSITPIFYITSRDEDATNEDRRKEWTKDRNADPRYWPVGTAQVYLGEGNLPESWPSSPFTEIEKQVVSTEFNIVSLDWGWFQSQTLPFDVEKHGPDFEFDLDSPWEEPPSHCRLIAIPYSDTGRTDENVAHTLAGTVTAVHEILKVLFFLDTPGIVELAEAQISRQVRRQAERSGAKIAQTIFVRQNTKRYERTDSDEHIEYSHRFEVRGHWKYYPEGTRTADARPDLLRYVPGRGMCRKIWCPPFVKGPEDKPLVIKTRRLRDEDAA